MTDTKKGSFSYEDLLTCAHGDMFGPGNPQLPLPPMLMMDRIITINDDGGSKGKGEIIAELDIQPDLWFFKCHFENDPVMPGCLGLDAMWQLVGFYLGWAGGQGRGRAISVGDVKFSGMVLETAKKVTYVIDIQRVIMRKLVLGVANGVMKVDGEPIYHANNMRVGLFSEDQAP